jgi:2-methylaconitate cis-trans-isomerase PrpF
MTMPARRIPCRFMRAGTSRGAFVLERHLPRDLELRDRVVLTMYGSPDPRQINGIGGGDALTSKIAVVERSSRPDADIDYTFGQVGIDQPQVFWVGNCGNMSAGVGVVAIEEGLVPAVEPETTVRIYNTNTKKILTATIPVSQGNVVETGQTAIAGVPGTAAPILLDFGECGGAVTGRTLPTGNPRDDMALDGRTVTVSIVDAATPFVFVRASDVGMAGDELPSQIDADGDLLRRLEEVRSFAARAIGLVADDQVAREVSPSIPRVVAVSQPAPYRTTGGVTVRSDDIDVLARQMAMQKTHKTFAVTGTLCTAVAAYIPGTVVNEVARTHSSGNFRLGHPGGVIEAVVRVRATGDDVSIERAAIVRTARTLMIGDICVPADIWPVEVA